MATNKRIGKPARGGQTAPPKCDLADETRELLDEGLRVPVDANPIGGTINVAGPGPDGAVPISGSGPGGAVPVSAAISGSLAVRLQRSESEESDDQAFWTLIRSGTTAIGFDAYNRFINRVLCRDRDVTQEERELLTDRVPSTGQRLHFGVDAYQLLKAATEAFLILRCGFVLDQRSFNAAEEKSRLGRAVTFTEIQQILERYLGDGLPYLRKILGALEPQDLAYVSPFCDDVFSGRAFAPCLLELIWSYWKEEGMLVQAINAISLRFQNKRGPAARDPLRELTLSPLRPLSNLLWGYIQDEPFRLTVTRRSYEYDSEYGLPLLGKAIPTMRPADHRSKFLEAFHSLLQEVSIFYDKDADTTVIADGFSILNGLQEVHMLLAEGAHNQFRDLPWTARVEMLIQQWLLSREEMREFLRARQMVPYRELWMGQVDTLKRLMGWNDTPVTHFRDLAVFGEQILLSIRYGNWTDVINENVAKNWARYWKAEVQSFLHAYRAVTGVDLGAGELPKQRVNATLPSVLLQRRSAQQRGQ